MNVLPNVLVISPSHSPAARSESRESLALRSRTCSVPRSYRESKRRDLDQMSRITARRGRSGRQPCQRSGPRLSGRPHGARRIGCCDGRVSKSRQFRRRCSVSSVGVPSASAVPPSVGMSSSYFTPAGMSGRINAIGRNRLLSVSFARRFAAGPASSLLRCTSACTWAAWRWPALTTLPSQHQQPYPTCKL